MTEYLAHHGIKGMKWGVRRTPEQLGHRPSARGKTSAVALTDGTLGYRHNQTYTNASGQKTTTTFVARDKRSAKVGARRAMLEQVGSDDNRATRKMQAQVRRGDRQAERQQIADARRKTKAMNAKSAKELYRYADFLDQGELNRQLSRVNSMTQIRNLKASEVSTGRKVATSILTQTATNVAVGAMSRQLTPYADIGAEYVTKKVIGSAATGVVNAKRGLHSKTARGLVSSMK